MPSRSSSLMSEASVNRAGGVVSCFLGSVSSRTIAVPSRSISSPTLHCGRIASCSSSSATGSSLPSTYARRNPANSIALPLAVSTAVAGWRLRGNLDRRPQHARVDHLRRHRALPDQVIDFKVVAVEGALELAWRKAEVGRDGWLRALPARSSPASDTAAGCRSTRSRTSRG